MRNCERAKRAGALHLTLQDFSRELGNLALTLLIPRITGGAETVSIRLAGLPGPVTAKVTQQAALWAVEGALLLGIATILIFGRRGAAAAGRRRRDAAHTAWRRRAYPSARGLAARGRVGRRRRAATRAAAARL